MSLRQVHLIVLALLCSIHAAAQLNTTSSSRFDSRDSQSHWAEAGDDTVRTENIPVGIYSWHINPQFGTVVPAQPDTLPHLFPNNAFTEGRTGHYLFTGNLGTPRVSRVADDNFVKNFTSGFFFANPYSYFLQRADELFFTNTKSPFMNITYHESNDKQKGEDHIRAQFATNANKRLGLGFIIDYLYGRGYYDSQSAAHFNGTLYASYITDRYNLHAYYSANHLKNAENGGIESDDYVNRPESFPTSYGTADIPTRLSKTWNRLNVNTFYLTHRYSLGFERFRDSQGRIQRTHTSSTGKGLLGKAIALPTDSLHSAVAQKDSASAPLLAAHQGPERPKVEASEADADDEPLTAEFVPVASIIHTFQLDHSNRRFVSNLAESASASTYFSDFYLPGDSANDKTTYLHLSNLLALELREGFNRWAKAGLRLFVSHDFHRYRLPAAAWTSANPVEDSFTENFISLGAQILKQQGRLFHTTTTAAIRTTGSEWGEFLVNFDADANIRLHAADTLRIRLDATARNEQPNFYLRHYHARNAWWDNTDLSKELHLRIGGQIAYRNTRLSLHYEHIKHHTVLAETLAPYTSASSGYTLALYSVGVRQAPEAIHTLTATLAHDIKLGPLHWDNEITYQTSSSDVYLPLPALNVYSNLYLSFRIARVLGTELGADVRYFTEYYAPTYSPIIGQFAIQDTDSRIKVGNYPIVNAYANFHLRNTRFYIMASHVNYSSGKGNPFILAHYPLNRMSIRFGISWNFFN